MLKAIIFDFDGVLCESVEAKTEAFRKVFLDYPDQSNEIIAYHMKHGGISRYKKFEYIYKEILKQTLTPEKSESLARKFTEYAYTEVVKAPLVKGTESFLEKHHKKLKLFVASGTPEDEMVLIAREKNMEHYFTGVYGSPKTKYDIAALVLQEHKLKSEEVIFVGDAISDYDGAHEAKIKFIGRLHPQYPNPFKDVEVAGYVTDLDQLEALIEKEFSL